MDTGNTRIAREPGTEIPMQESDGLHVEDTSLRAEEVIGAQIEQRHALENHAPLFLP